MSDPTKAFDAENGFFIDQDTGVWIGGGAAVPTLNAPEGSHYYRTSPAQFYIQGGSGLTNDWQLQGSAGGRIIDLSFNDSSGPSVGTNSQSYDIMGSFIYPGNGQVEIDTSKICMTGSVDGSARVFDFTNSTTICEVTGLVLDGNKTIFDMGTLSNLPSGAAVFEVQIKKDQAGGGTVELHSLSMYKDLTA